MKTKTKVLRIERKHLNAYDRGFTGRPTNMDKKTVTEKYILMLEEKIKYYEALNARLLESCKDLLTALLSFERDNPTGIESLEWIKKAKVAIVKAEGK